MEIRIGVQNVARELVLESDASSDEINKKVDSALEGKGPLRLEDSKGRVVLVPANVLGYVEIGTQTPRPVGFAATS